MTTLRTPASLALLLLSPLLLSGCTSTGTDMASTQARPHAIAAMDADRDVALAEAASQASTYCKRMDRSDYTVIDQTIEAPADGPGAIMASALQKDAMISEDTDLEAATQEGDGFQVNWLVRCS
ncbi:hypothetical protein [Larsenimonas rhizosphaerae]|uniref:hypothetical protein n=1 Tax=Larsenimonas rhizosphaerae TaxID=2944682 RepID=UPI002033E27E|nr:hypothetical protein [Larsenimonas rhizosphaerae]MCM2130599.1 hypothetical protein [Larsenimonas rhizosphaerae]